MEKFEEGKRYVFDKEKFLSNPSMALRYKNSIRCREWVDDIDGLEVVTQTASLAKAGEWGVVVDWCEEIVPHMAAIVREVCQQRYQEGEPRWI